MKLQIFFILLISIMIPHAYALSEQKDQNLIETTCKNTPNYRLCVTILRANRRSATADVAGLGLIMVDAVKAKTKEALSAVNKLIHSHDRKLSEAAQQCVDAYNGVLKGDVPEAVEALTKGDPKFAENGMADAVVEADSCDSAFETRSPLSGMNKALRDRAVVARAIIRNLL
ncbi:hypothetical protein CDL12_04020 [Handroanthus impetiginosus]|uniref:Pectinesterase inhibitor domain-containing protein n=1 Tax=Handroanthus impetiginosus TaxID=429701 RepID=A0A2G9I0H6_9LAMI|nr:hypothetical protein CDL12_04020 [Handroanthus impetiginosus]